MVLRENTKILKKILPYQRNGIYGAAGIRFFLSRCRPDIHSFPEFSKNYFSIQVETDKATYLNKENNSEQPPS